jgi:putative phosphoesterase
MTKIAVLSDVHGNVGALRATIQDAQLQGAEEFWFLGDLFMPGPGTQDLMAILRSVNTTVWLRGNWDDFLFQTLEESVAYQKPTHVYSARLSAYVLSQLTKGDLTFIRELPIAAEREIDQLTFQVSHNLRDKNDGHELLPMMPQQGFDRLLEGTKAEVAIYGHTHQPILKASSDGRLILNPGSVGSPFSLKAKLRRNREARYLILTVDGSNVQEDFRTVAYDLGAEVALAKKRGLPYLGLYEALVFEGYGYLHDPGTVDEVNQQFDYVLETKTMIEELRHKFS